MPTTLNAVVESVAGSVTPKQLEALTEYAELLGWRNFQRSPALAFHLQGDVDSAFVAMRLDKRLLREDRRKIAKLYMEDENARQ